MFGKNLVISLIFFGLTAGCSSSPKEITNPAGDQSRFPNLTVDNSGTFFMSWLEPGESENETLLKYSRFQNEQWSDPQTITSGKDWFVNWADFPSLIIQNNEPLAAHWLQKIEGGPYAYNVNMKLKQNRGEWTYTLSPHDDSTATEHGFVSMVRWSEESVLAIWLDGRKTADRANDEYSDLSKAMTLRSAVINTSGTVSNKQEIDATVCDCCNTSMARTEDGAIAAYRDRTEEEVRDIYVSRFNGDGWSEPTIVHEDGWKIGACPVNGPQVAVYEETVAVAWFTGAQDDYRVHLAFSSDSGRSFGEPIVVNENEAIGRVDLAINEFGETYISWMEEERNNRASINVSKFSADNEQINSGKVATVSRSRNVGFPQLAQAGRQLLLAWTEVSENEENYSIKTASLAF